jgi:hypothetical protein
MDLLLQVAGVLGAALIISALVRGRPLRPRLERSTVAFIAAVAATLLFLGHVRGDVNDFRTERKALAGVSSFDAYTADGANNGQNVAFLKWARQRMGGADTFAMMPADMVVRVDQFVPYQWSLFQLMPHRSVAPGDADWLVFYGTSPADVNYDKRQFAAPIEYSPFFAAAKRRNES